MDKPLKLSIVAPKKPVEPKPPPEPEKVGVGAKAKDEDGDADELRSPKTGDPRSGDDEPAA